VCACCCRARRRGPTSARAASRPARSRRPFSGRPTRGASRPKAEGDAGLRICTRCLKAKVKKGFSPPPERGALGPKADSFGRRPAALGCFARRRRGSVGEPGVLPRPPRGRLSSARGGRC
jgi:hypothetical protein